MKKLKNLFAIFGYINNHPLAGRHRFVAYSKFIRWQLTQALHPSEKKMPFLGETYLLVNKSMKGATGNIYFGLHEFHEMGFLLHFLKKGDLFADIGANIGSYSVLASGVNKAMTIAFEPSLKTFTQLQKNISINHLGDKVKAYNLALGASAGKLYFTTDLDTVNHIVPSYELNKTMNRVEVSVDTLDNIVKNSKVPSLVKIDVEGFETDVINGMTDTLSNEDLKAIIIELNGSGMRYDYNENDIHTKLISHSFRPYLYDPFKRHFILSDGHGVFNTLYLRDIEFVKKAVQEAKKIKIFNEEF